MITASSMINTPNITMRHFRFKPLASTYTLVFCIPPPLLAFLRKYIAYFFARPIAMGVVDDGIASTFQDRLLKWKQNQKNRHLRRMKKKISQEQEDAEEEEEDQEDAEDEDAEEEDAEEDSEDEDDVFYAAESEDEMEISTGLYLPAYVHAQLYDYQIKGLQWMWKCHQAGTGGILGDEMGLGKSKCKCIITSYSLNQCM